MSMNERYNLEEHEHKYKTKAWDDYTLEELGNWVHLLTKRAGHRADIIKAHKDLDDAGNYLTMMKMKIQEVRDSL